MHKIINDDVLTALKDIPNNTYDGMLSDFPYALKMMGKDWDKAIPSVEVCSELLRVLKPGAYALVYGGTRTHHRLWCNLEDAGFLLRDNVVFWIHSQGFSKGQNISKAIDKKMGVEREVVGKTLHQDIRGGNFIAEDKDKRIYCPISLPATPQAKHWDGYNTALSPSWEIICVGQKPLDGTYVENCLKWGCGALNVGQTRIKPACESRQTNNQALLTLHDDVCGILKSDSSSLDDLASISLSLLRDAVSHIFSVLRFDNNGGTNLLHNVISHNHTLNTLSLASVCDYDLLIQHVKKYDLDVASILNSLSDYPTLYRFYDALFHHREAPFLDIVPSQDDVHTYIVGRQDLLGSNLGYHNNLPHAFVLVYLTYTLYKYIGVIRHNIQSTSGRWPKNLIISHLPDCKYLGNEIIKEGKEGAERHNTQAVQKNSYGGGYNEITSYGYGEETIELYDCVDGCPVKALNEQRGYSKSVRRKRGRGFSSAGSNEGYKRQSHNNPDYQNNQGGYDDEGGVARFYYNAKCSPFERNAGCEELPEHSPNHGKDGGPEGFGLSDSKLPVRNDHISVKPLDLNRYLATLILPPARETPRKIFCPYSGSGSEMIGALQAGWDDATGIELDKHYCEIAEARLKYWIDNPYALD